MTVDYWGEAPAAQPVIVAALKAGLTAAGDPAHVGSKAPRNTSDPSAPRIRIQRIGGGEESFAIDAPLLLIECWDPSEAEAERRANRVIRILKEAAGRRFAGGYIHRWQLISGPVNNPDPDTSSERFQLTGVLALAIE